MLGDFAQFFCCWFLLAFPRAPAAPVLGTVCTAARAGQCLSAAAPPLHASLLLPRLSCCALPAGQQQAVCRDWPVTGQARVWQPAFVVSGGQGGTGQGNTLERVLAWVWVITLSERFRDRCFSRNPRRTMQSIRSGLSLVYMLPVRAARPGPAPKPWWRRRWRPCTQVAVLEAATDQSSADPELNDLLNRIIVQHSCPHSPSVSSSQELVRLLAQHRWE